ncbi:MAG: DNA repair protein RecN, partial [Bradyrhizobiaceae bacterium]|nr:DNA repair protein RecN [Bradyrhizobiaceae bacterium]
LDAFALSLGARGDARLVRQGAEQGLVIAAFDAPVDHPAHNILRANGIAAEDEVILRRVQLADGRTRASVNDQPVSVQVLKSLGAALVEIHGQHDERALVEASTHRRLLDAFGGLEGMAREVERLWNACREAEATLESHRSQVERAEREADWLRHAVEELAELVPEVGEETKLAEQRSARIQAEKVAQDLRDAHASVAGAESPVSALSVVLRRLERRQLQAPGLIEPVVKALDAALNAIEEARSHLDMALGASEHDSHALECIEERLFALRAASRKYNVPIDELNALGVRYRSDLALIDTGTERLAALASTAAQAREHYANLADTLSSQRRRVAENLDSAVNAELKPLKLERATFSTEIATDPATTGSHGIDRIEFWVRTNPGTRRGPLIRVASGGELARFLLALKAVLADRGSAPTLVFDEIDTGVGGAVADAIGVRLARLGRRVQTLAVTHAPQVAARADHHYLITKNVLDKGKRVATRVSELAAANRREEIARMLAGAEITEEARAAAERLMRAAVGVIAHGA